MTKDDTRELAWQFVMLTFAFVVVENAANLLGLWTLRDAMFAGVAVFAVIGVVIAIAFGIKWPHD